MRYRIVSVSRNGWNDLLGEYPQLKEFPLAKRVKYFKLHGKEVKVEQYFIYLNSLEDIDRLLNTLHKDLIFNCKVKWITIKDCEL